MRFSEAPLWWRGLVIAVTLAILWAVYAVTAWLVTLMSDPVLYVVGVVVYGAAIVALVVGVRRDRLARRDRDKIAQRRNPPLE